MTSPAVARRELPLLTDVVEPGPSPGAPVSAESRGGPTMPLSEFFQRIGYVTLKLTNGCNLHCSYCNVEAVTPQTPKMSMDRFKQVARLLLENTREPYVGLEFHGGEPLLLPDEWFEEATAYAKALA